MLSNVLVLENLNNHPDYANGGGGAIIVPKVDYILLPWFAMNLFINERTFCTLLRINFLKLLDFNPFSPRIRWCCWKNSCILLITKN